MNACSPPCVGAWYPPGSGVPAQNRCNTAPATAAVRTYWGRSLIRCTHKKMSPSLYCNLCKAAETNLSSNVSLQGPHGQRATLCHPGWRILWVAEAGQRQAALLHILPSDRRVESGQRRGPGWTRGPTRQQEDPWKGDLLRLDKGWFGVSCRVISIADSCAHLEQRSREGSCGGNCHFSKRKTEWDFWDRSHSKKCACVHQVVLWYLKLHISAKFAWDVCFVLSLFWELHLFDCLLKQQQS